MSEYVADLTDKNWEAEVLNATTPVLVDFWAAWCGPCRALAPTIDTLGEKFQGRAKVFKLNVDENPESPAKYGIRGIPTLILFKGGLEVERQVGAPNNPLAVISSMIEQHL